MDNTFTEPPIEDISVTDVLADGRDLGLPPEKIAQGVKTWQEKTYDWADGKLGDTDPAKLFDRSFELDKTATQALQGLQTAARDKWFGDNFKTPEEAQRFSEALQATGGDPAAMSENDPAYETKMRDYQNRVLTNPVFAPASAKSDTTAIYSGSIPVARFTTRDNGKSVGALVDIPQEDGTALKTRLKVAAVSDEDIAKEIAKTQAAQKSAEDMQNSILPQKEPEGVLDRMLSGVVSANTDPQAHDVLLKKYLKDAEQAKLRLDALKDPATAKNIIIQERVAEALKNSPVAGKVGKGLWSGLAEDAQRGLVSFVNESAIGAADAVGATETRDKLRGFQAVSEEAMPGSSGSRFRGGTAGTVSEFTDMMGNMAPTTALALATGGLSAEATTAAKTAARLAPLISMAPSLYGGAVDRTLGEADQLDAQAKQARQNGDAALADTLEARAKDFRENHKAYGAASTAAFIAPQFLFHANELFKAGKGALLPRIAKAAGAGGTEMGVVAGLQGQVIDPAFGKDRGTLADIAHQAGMGAAMSAVNPVLDAMYKRVRPAAKTPEQVLTEAKAQIDPAKPAESMAAMQTELSKAREQFAFSPPVPELGVESGKPLVERPGSVAGGSVESAAAGDTLPAEPAQEAPSVTPEASNATLPENTAAAELPDLAPVSPTTKSEEVNSKSVEEEPPQPVEPKRSEGSTGINNETVYAERDAIGQDPIIKDAVQSNPETFRRALKQLEDNPNAAKDLIEKTNSGELNRFNEEDQALLLHDRVRLTNEMNRQADRAADENLSEEERRAASSTYDDLAAERHQNDLAAERSGSVGGRLLQFRQRQMLQDYSFEALERAESKTRHRPLTLEERDQVKVMADKIAWLEKKLVEHTEKSTGAKRAKAYDDFEKQAASVLQNGEAHPVIQKAVSRISEMARQARERLKSRFAPAESAPDTFEQKLARRSDISKWTPEEMALARRTSEGDDEAWHELPKFKQQAVRDALNRDIAASFKKLTATEGERQSVESLQAGPGDLVKINGKNFQVKSADENGITIRNPEYGSVTLKNTDEIPVDFHQKTKPSPLSEPGEPLAGKDKVIKSLIDKAPVDHVSTSETDAQIREALEQEEGGDSKSKVPDGVKGAFVQKSKAPGTKGKSVLYLNLSRVSADTPIHEIVGHQFMDWIRANHPEIWNKGKSLLEQNPDFLNAIHSRYFDEIEAVRAAKGDAAADLYLYTEAAATVLGKKGQDVWQSTAASRTLFGQVKAWAQRMLMAFKRWGANKGLFGKEVQERWAKDFGINGITLEEWATKANMALRTGAFKNQIKSGDGEVRYSKSGDDETVSDLAAVGAEKLSRGTTERSTWNKEMVDEFGKDVEPHLDAAWESANAQVEKEFAAAPPRARQKAASGKRKENIEAGLKRRIAEGDSLKQMQPLVRGLALEFIQKGVRGREAVVDAVHGILSKDLPELSKAQTEDLISNYGDFRKLDNDPDKSLLRGYKGELLQIGKIRDMMGGEAPKATGVERARPTDENRRLTKEVNDLKKKGEYKVRDPDAVLRGAQDSVKTRLGNEVRDLDHAIALGEPMKPRTGSVTYDQEMTTLKAQRDAKKAQYNEMFPKSKTPLTPEQQIERSAKYLDRQIAELTDQIKSGNVDPKARKEPVSPPELAAKRAQLETLKAERQLLRDLDAQKIEDKKIAALEKKIEDLKNGVSIDRKGPVLTADTAELARLKEQKSQIVSLQDYKVRKLKQIEALQSFATTGVKPPPRAPRPFVPDAEANRLAVEVQKAKAAAKSRELQIKQDQETTARKWSRRVVNMNRVGVLSHISVLEHLAGSAVEQVLTRPLATLAAQPMRLHPTTRAILAKSFNEGRSSSRSEIAAHKTLTSMETLNALWDKLRTGKSNIDYLFGKGVKYPKRFLETVLHIHGAIKEPVRQYHFARSLELRLEAAEKMGLDPQNDPVLLDTFKKEAYAYANREIFMGDNLFSSYFKKGIGLLRNEKLDSGAANFIADVLEVLSPVVNVPVNIAIRTLRMLPPVGFGESAIRLGRAAARGELKNNAATLSERDADLITKTFKYGLFGTALGIYAWTHANQFGGVRSPGQQAPKDKKSGLDDGEIALPGGGHLSHHLTHGPTGTYMNLVADIRRTWDEAVKKNPDNKWNALTKASGFAVLANLNGVPMVRTIGNLVSPFKSGEQKAGEMIRNMVEFGVLQDAAEAMDGKRRSPKNFTDQLKLGIPGLREQVPESKVQDKNK